MRNTTPNNHDPLSYILAMSIDPRVFVGIYVWNHPDQSQASLSKEFGMTPAAFGKVIHKNADYLRPDWYDKICELLRDTDIAAYKVKFERIVSLNEHLGAYDLQKNNGHVFDELLSQAKSVDPRVCIGIYIWGHPEQSQYSLSNEFGMTPAAFNKALNKNRDYLRPDWYRKICELLRNTDIAAYEVKFRRIVKLKEYLDASDAQQNNIHVSDDMLDLLLEHYGGTTGALLRELKEYRMVSGHKQVYQIRYDEHADRYMIGDRDLHCGDTFEVLIIDSVTGEQRWVAVRIEMNSNNKWYLVGAQDYQLDGLFAR